MSRLIDVNKIDWQEGVFVNPNTKEPLPIIHKMATIEMLRDWQEGVQAIPLDKVKQARRELDKLPIYGAKFTDDFRIHLDREEVFSILDKLIEESEDKVCRGCHYDDGEVHAECVVCDKVEMESEE